MRILKRKTLKRVLRLESLCGPGGNSDVRVLALPTRGVLLRAFCRATILMTYSVPAFRSANTDMGTSETRLPIGELLILVCVSTPTFNDGVGLRCTGPGEQFSRDTASFLVGDVVSSDPWAAGRLPGKGDAVGVQGGEMDVGGRDDYRFGCEMKKQQRMFTTTFVIFVTYFSY